jgi:hypothetical protein
MIFKSRQNFNATCNIYPNGEIPPNLVTLLGLLKRALKATLLTGGATKVDICQTKSMHRYQICTYPSN